MFRLPAAHPASLRCLRSAVPPVHSHFVPTGVECDAGGQGFSLVRSGYPLPDSRWRRQGLPGSWGTRVYVPCSSTPAGPGRQAIRRFGAVFRHLNGVDSRKSGYFRGSITRPTHSLCTLRRAGCPNATQHALPAAGQALPGGIGYPLGSIERFPRFVILSSHNIASPFPRLRLAQ
jgi:hypothetical protein